MARVLPECLGILYVIFVIYLSSVNGISTSTTTDTDEERKVYIVYMGFLPKSEEYSPTTHHLSILQQAVDSSRSVEQSLIRSYKRSFNGFAASLTNQEKQNIAARDDVLLIFPSQTRQLHTTASWDFMNFRRNVQRNLTFESDIIIGMVDTGIWPESKSFDDHGFGPIPKKWKGACEGGKNFTCNKKLIGARNYFPGEDSARDMAGHGSHTASTAAGNNVENASFYGIAEGTARGGVPSARIAAYKVCNPLGCSDDAILKAFDDAIADGVDILSLSLGSSSAIAIQEDTIAIGSFHALMKGILTVNSAGNSGNMLGSVSSTAPWLFTVAATTISRKFVSKVALGNGRTLSSNSINAFKLNGTQIPLVDAKSASKNCTADVAEQCIYGCLDRNLVKGKIVLCNTSAALGAIAEINRTDGVGLILSDDNVDIPSVTPYPLSPLSPELFQRVVDYTKSTKTPKANFLMSEAVEDVSAPIVAPFSSRGPNQNFPDILKPDISAPGVDILAAYSPASPPSEVPDVDRRSVSYNIISGTSMSCPHVTGAAAYVKSLHPNWSPSTIKSALMTTAWKMNATHPKNRDAEFGYGAGHLDPTKAAEPGLVYETLTLDYIGLLCGSNISRTVPQLFGYNITCDKVVPLKATDLNYPTFAAQVRMNKRFRVTFPRTVTNVGPPNSTYRAIISGISRLNVTVEPNTLSFKTSNETKSFVVTVAGENVEQKNQILSASLEWSDGIHSVRSPIVVYSFS